LNLEKYSFEQSACFSKLVQDKINQLNIKKGIAEKVVVISKSPILMDHPQEVAHLNFDEMVFGFFPDNIESEKELDEAVKHEVAHLKANLDAFPNFHKKMKQAEVEKKVIPKRFISRKKPNHNIKWKRILDEL